MGPLLALKANGVSISVRTAWIFTLGIWNTKQMSRIQACQEGPWNALQHAT